MRHLQAVPQVAPRAVLYLRQSIARDDSISIELQEIAGRDYCATNGYEVAAVEIDAGLSGRNWTKRPAVQRVLDMVESGNADVIVLWKWSRLSRNRTDWALAADRVDVAGGRIESATEPIDTATASGRFARGVMTEYAAFQSEQIGEQWNEVHTRRFNLGLPPHGSVPWGWNREKTRIWPDPERAAAVRDLYARYLSGEGWGKLVAAMNASRFPAPRGGRWTATTVRVLLDSPIHAGIVTYRGAERQAAHEGIISRADWEQYKAMRSDRSIPKRKRESEYLLSSLVICGPCGRKRSGKVTRNKRRDGSTVTYHSYCCYVNAHPNKSILTKYVDAAVGEWVKSVPARAAAPQAGSGKAEVARLSREITSLERELARATRQLTSEVISEAAYLVTRREIEAEQEALNKELTRVRLASVRSPAAAVSGREDLIQMWDLLEFGDQQSIVQALIESVTINADKTISIRSAWGEVSVLEI